MCRSRCQVDSPPLPAEPAQERASNQLVCFKLPNTKSPRPVLWSSYSSASYLGYLQEDTTLQTVSAARDLGSCMGQAGGRGTRRNEGTGTKLGLGFFSEIWGRSGAGGGLALCCSGQAIRKPGGTWPVKGTSSALRIPWHPALDGPLPAFLFLFSCSLKGIRATALLVKGQPCSYSLWIFDPNSPVPHLASCFLDIPQAWLHILCGTSYPAFTCTAWKGAGALKAQEVSGALEIVGVGGVL